MLYMSKWLKTKLKLDNLVCRPIVVDVVQQLALLNHNRYA